MALFVKFAVTFTVANYELLRTFDGVKGEVAITKRSTGNTSTASTRKEDAA